MQTPEAIVQHEASYKPNAWCDYTLLELGMWVSLFHKRASMRSDEEKKAKDLLDARNYWRMMGSWLDAAEKSAQS